MKLLLSLHWWVKPIKKCSLLNSISKLVCQPIKGSNSCLYCFKIPMISDPTDFFCTNFNLLALSMLHANICSYGLLFHEKKNVLYLLKFTLFFYTNLMTYIFFLITLFKYGSWEVVYEKVDAGGKVSCYHNL